MNCEQAGELVGAFALDALPEEEAAAFRAHIATCEEHARLAAELRAAAALLPESVDAVEPPLALRTRLLEAIEREPQETAPATLHNLPSAARERDARRGRGAWFAPNAWTAIAAALALVAMAAVAWAIASGDGGDGEELAAASDVRSLVDADGTRVGTVVIYEDERRAQVIFDDLPDAGAGNAYQMWSIEGGLPVSIGVMDEGASGQLVQVVEIDPARSEALAVTIEPAGGSEQPTSDPVFITAAAAPS